LAKTVAVSATRNPASAARFATASAHFRPALLVRIDHHEEAGDGLRQSERRHLDRAERRAVLDDHGDPEVLGQDARRHLARRLDEARERVRGGDRRERLPDREVLDERLPALSPEVTDTSACFW